MATTPLHRVIQHVLADLGPDGGMTDAELLARFLASRDDNALAALVRRHAPMVWAVCCRLLANHHDAEDAFQATFLVLVRRAADVPRQAVANWLYGVARQTAVRLRATAAKRGRRETQVMTMPEPTAAEACDADLRRVLDEELSRLPDHYRGVLVLCDLEGMTRREAARQLSIPEGSVASRLARARVMLAKRLTRRGVVVAGGSVAAAVSAPPALVASTIEAVTLVAAGQTAGVISAKVAALTEGVVNAMFMNRLKSALTVVLVLLGLGTATFGLGVLADGGPNQQPREPDMIVNGPDGEKPKGAGQQPAQAKQEPAKSDRERMVGNWFITNDDSKRKGEMWVFTEDSILMNAKNTTPMIHAYFHRLDAGKEPRQIDITVKRGNGPTVGVIKGIYTLAGDELRLCLGELGKDRPAAFPRKPGPGEVLVLQRESFKQPKQEQPAAKTEEQKKGGFTAWGQEIGGLQAGLGYRPGEKRAYRQGETVRVVVRVRNVGKEAVDFKHIWAFFVENPPRITDADGKLVPLPKYRTRAEGSHLPRSSNVAPGKEVELYEWTFDLQPDGENSSRSFIHGTGKFSLQCERIVGPTSLNPDHPNPTLSKLATGKLELEIKTAPPKQKKKKAEKPATKEERLRLLIDQVLAAHGGEAKLNKLQFTMTVKHSNGETQHYYVQPPTNFRWETTHRDRTGKRIVILFPERRRWWTQEPNEAAMEFIPTGLEPMSVEGWRDYVNFFGPRQVLRLKDADHKVALLDEEATIGGRAAVGVQVTGSRCNQKMYFDKETHLLVKGYGANLREANYSDYKTFDGIPIARKENDGHFMPEVTDFRAVEKLDGKLFERP